MKKWRIRIVVALVAAVLLIPRPVGIDDGGTVIYTAVLYQVTMQHSMAYEGETFGYLTGTRVRVLFFEVYSDVKFVPSERN